MPIELRGRKWFAYLSVPADVRGKLGRRVFRQALKTDSRSVAERRAGSIVGRWKELIEEARGNPNTNDASFYGFRPVLPVRRRAREPHPDGSGRTKGEVADLERGLAAVGEATTPEERQRALERLYGISADIEYRLATVAARPEAVEPAGIETTAHVDEWSASLHHTPKVKNMRRADVLRFAETFRTLDMVRRPAVLRWTMAMMNEGAGLSVRTVKGALAAVRGYWRWLEGQGVVAEGSGAALERLDLARRGKREGGQKERREEFKPAEVIALLKAAQAAGDSSLAHIITLAMWTGCRVSELAALMVADIDLTAGSESITIREGKTEAAARVIPIHSALLLEMVALIDGRATGWLLEGLTANKYGDRSCAVGRRFGRLKTAMGFGPDKVLHSIRRTVSTLLENGGVLENVAADIMGHEKPRITYGGYSGGASLEVKRLAIERLSYPEPA